MNIKKLLINSSLAALILASSTVALAGHQYIETRLAPAPIGPYSQGVLVNNALYLSGQIALDSKSGKLVTDNIEAETDTVMQNLKAILGAAHMDFTNTVKATIYVSNMNDFDRINQIYGKFFQGNNAPAREKVQIARLPKSAHVEISMIAVKEGSAK